MGGWRQHREIYGYALLAKLPYALLMAVQQHDELRGIDYEAPLWMNIRILIRVPYQV